MFESMINKEVILISLIFPEDSPAGHLLGDIIYSDFLSSTLARGKDYTAAPNDGCKNKLYLRMPVEDIMAFADLIDETFIKYLGKSELVKAIRAKVYERLAKENQRLNIRGN
jgi:hypothetical protein